MESAVSCCVSGRVVSGPPVGAALVIWRRRSTEAPTPFDQKKKKNVTNVKSDHQRTGRPGASWSGGSGDPWLSSSCLKGGNEASCELRNSPLMTVRRILRRQLLVLLICLTAVTPMPPGPMRR
ncbi:hypothetical protein EYF80_040999 [Liparis tanakae]|uniref:Uncharacterized protein n=1 Tax=Liparis tanakae TaxID=230148 RepID=A0A4Z2G7P8_9TELE|nr:hypothetical protein EYF80_040999 [Liparis tanakae]